VTQTQPFGYITLSLAAAGTGSQLAGYQDAAPIFFWCAALFAFLALLSLVRSPSFRPFLHKFLDYAWTGPPACKEDAGDEGIYSRTDSPNWPVHELFYYLCPDLVDRPGERLWQMVGAEVREKFSMDENNTLRVSGIPVENDQMENWFSSNI
jgi:hypothetical protein